MLSPHLQCRMMGVGRRKFMIMSERAIDRWGEKMKIRWRRRNKRRIIE